MSNRQFPPQHQDQQPGRESDMDPRPISDRYPEGKRLAGKVALISGGDSGIGRAVDIAFAREGSDLAIAYLEEHDDAKETVELIERQGRRCLTLAGDVGEEFVCQRA